MDLLDLYRGSLSLRQVSVYVAGLPPGSATWAAIYGVPQGLTMTDFLLMDVYHALTGEEHPARPKSQKRRAHEASDLRARLRAQSARLREQREAPQPRT